jgi:hypothetical protein
MKMRNRTWRPAALGVLALAGCTGDLLDAAHAGSLRILIRTGGIDLPATYLVEVDGRGAQPISPNSPLDVRWLDAGNHTVAVREVASNCRLDGAAMQTVQVASSDLTQVTFAAVCLAAWGVIQVEVAGLTSVGLARGMAYSLSLDGTVRPIQATGPGVSFKVAGGAHTIALSDLPSRCALPAEGSRVVTVGSGGPVRDTVWVRFDLACSPANTSVRRLVFARNLGTRSYLYAVNGDGSGLRPLMEGDHPAVSPDGRHIAFEQNGDLYVMTSELGEIRRLVGGAQEATWSPDGQRIAYTSTVDHAIHVSRFDGASPPVRLTNPGGEDWDLAPAWSPDGRQIAFCRWEWLEFQTVWIVNLDGTGEARAARQGTAPGGHTGQVWWAAWSPVWSYDHRIAFTGPDGAGGILSPPFRQWVFVMQRNGGEPRGIVSPEPLSFIESVDDWSPDGEWIALTLWTPQGSMVHLLGDEGVLIPLGIEGPSRAAAFLHAGVP